MEHEAVLVNDRIVCKCGDYNCASLDVIEVCSFALGRGQYCFGHPRFPSTHATVCPGYSVAV